MKNNISIYRKEKNMTQRELSEKVKITETQIRNIEKDRSIPKVDIALKIAKILDKKVEEIFRIE